MNSLNPDNFPTLRKPEIMLAYLKNQAALEEIEQIELLMDQDPLYQLAMEQLAARLQVSPSLRAADLKAESLAFEQSLSNAHDQFVQQNTGQASPSFIDQWNSLPAWQRWLGPVLLAAVIAFLIIPRGTAIQLHIDPAENLVPDQDILTAELFHQSCIDSVSRGLGRNNSISLESALMDVYVAGEYAEAARQFEILRRGAQMEEECSGRLLFYLAKSYMAEKQYPTAAQNFEAVLQLTDTPEGVKNASHWYLANLYLLDKNYENAEAQLTALLASDNSAEHHLPALMELQYLESARKYLAKLSG